MILKLIDPVTCCIKNDYFSVSGNRYECYTAMCCTKLNQSHVLGLLLTKSSGHTFSFLGFCFCCDSYFGFLMGCPYIPSPIFKDTIMQTSICFQYYQISKVTNDTSLTKLQRLIKDQLVTRKIQEWMNSKY